MFNRSKVGSANAKAVAILAGGLSIVFITGCGHCWRHHKKAENTAAVSNTGVMYAKSVVTPTKGNRVHGNVWFTEEFGKVRVQGTIYGLKPNTKHGFHIHEYGDCTAPDGSSAGAHFNPTHEPHGGLQSPRHAGDMGNIVADAHGRAKIDLVAPNLSINGTINPIIGRGLIIHENPDDLVSQPVGNAGPRLACGVIGAASEPKSSGAPAAAPAKKSVKKVMRHRKQSA